jgi:hypothetical protein
MPITLDGTNGVTTNSGTLISATTIGVGGATPSTSGAGITFPATQSASTDANTLDDYEEGTWTPSFQLNGSTSGITYTSREGRYTKIGNMVTIFFNISLSNKGSSTGSATMTGLPFTPITAVGANGLFGGTLIGDFNMSSQQVYSYALAYSDGTLYFRTSGGSGAVAMTNSVFTNSSIFYYTATYQTA